MEALKGRYNAPAIMLPSLTGALLFVLSHHAFYQHLDSMHVSSTTFTQQVNTAAGMAFAFLVRALLVVALTSAYAQVLWSLLLVKTLCVATVDSLSALLSPVWELCDIRLVWR